MNKRFTESPWLINKTRLAAAEGPSSVGPLVDFLRFRMGFTYGDCAKVFKQACGLDADDFEALMQEVDDCENSQ